MSVRPTPVHPTPVGLAPSMHPERPCIRRPRAQSVHASLAYASYTRACAVVPSLLRRASISEPPVLEHILHTCARMSFRTVRGFYLRWARDSQQTRSNPEARHNCGRGKQTKGRAGRWEGTASTPGEDGRLCTVIGLRRVHSGCHVDHDEDLFLLRWRS